MAVEAEARDSRMAAQFLEGRNGIENDDDFAFYVAQILKQSADVEPAMRRKIQDRNDEAARGAFHLSSMAQLT